MIVSASRRSDIPAFHGAWFMEQLRRGEVTVRNPFRPDRARAVSLKKQDVAAFVFWSRDPRPFLPYLPALDDGGYPYYFLLTATGYPRRLEPFTPAVRDAVKFFAALAARIGRRRVIWRYDPVIFSAGIGFDFHIDNFLKLTGLLSPFASRVIVSFFDPYPKVLRRLRNAGTDVETATGTPESSSVNCSGRFAAIAVRSGLEIQSCAEAAIAAGVRPGEMRR